MLRMLVVVAHPDDETFGTGSCIAHAAANGVDVTVCCATRGEAGEDTSGTTASREELARVREAELRAAAAVLGARNVVVFHFGDSHMQGEPKPGSLMSQKRWPGTSYCAWSQFVFSWVVRRTTPLACSKVA